MSNCILKTLNIKDKNITFENDCLTEEYRENSKVLVYTGTLSPQTPKYCPKCGCINENYSIIKNGRKVPETKVPKEYYSSIKIEQTSQLHDLQLLQPLDHD